MARASSAPSTRSWMDAKPAFGGSWNGNVAYFREISKPYTQVVVFGKMELSKLPPDVSAELNDPISEIYVFDTPLTSSQITKAIFRHCFVVLKTKTGFWSIEKNSKGIILQNDHSLNALTNVVNKVAKEDRLGETSRRGYRR